MGVLAEASKCKVVGKEKEGLVKLILSRQRCDSIDESSLTFVLRQNGSLAIYEDLEKIELVCESQNVTFDCLLQNKRNVTFSVSKANHARSKDYYEAIIKQLREETQIFVKGRIVTPN